MNQRTFKKAEVTWIRDCYVWASFFQRGSHEKMRGEIHL